MRRPIVWLRQIFRNSALDSHRGSKWSDSIAFSEDYDEQPELVAPQTVDDSGELAEAMSELQRSDALSYKILLLVAIGENASEIAVTLGFPHATGRELVAVNRRVRHAQERLQKLLPKETLDQFFGYSKKPSIESSSYGDAVVLGSHFKNEIFRTERFLSHEEAVAMTGGVYSGDLAVEKLELVLVHSEAGERYPAWQFERGIREHMSKILALLHGNTDAWAAYLFFTQPNPNLDGKTPLHALREDRVDEVLDAAAAAGSDSAGAG